MPAPNPRASPVPSADGSAAVTPPSIAVADDR
jgi:hypothetical protein